MQLIVEPSLLDKMVGRWVLRGTIARKAVVHDVNSDWVLGRHYVRIHEVSREKGTDGQSEYESMVFVARNDKGEYSCVWLDVFGGLSVLSIGAASQTGTELPFSFRNERGEVDLRNVFAYNPKDDSWEWRIDNIQNGLDKEFARVRLTRRETTESD
ncbi:hypothetical protein J2P12_02060 [Candidatus Bathyarchaeota archaeon]|nr:hypothetical protein [Candidatus Bathyarchaeota archaeon]